MKRVLYCSMRDRYKRNKSYGVVNKIDAQKKCFKHAGCKVFLRSPKGGNIVLPGGRRISNGKWDKISLPKQIDFMYVRFDAADRSFVRLLKKYKKENPKGKVLLEIPTYPFKDHYATNFGYLYYLQSLWGIQRARKYLDRIVLIANPANTLWKKPVLHINNGIDYETVRVRKPAQNREEIHIICVSTFSLAHGYDRLIEGLKSYYDKDGNEKIFLHMVGDGKERSHLQRLVQKYGLERNVLFHGVLKGTKLDHIYDICDLAGEVFGLHRQDVHISSSLKSREYAARGVPMLTSSQLDIDHADTTAYICRFPAAESAIDFEKVVRFYKTIYNGNDKQMIADTVRNTFKKYCSADENFKKVITFIQNNDR